MERDTGTENDGDKVRRATVSRRGWLKILWTTVAVTGATWVASVGQTRVVDASQERSAKASRKLISHLTFSGVPYRYAVQRVAQSLGLSVLLDRRLDPDSPVELVIDQPTEGVAIFRQFAGLRDAVAMEWGDLIFLTPSETVATISSARKAMSTELKRAKSRVRAALLRKRRVHWEDYAQPRRLIARWCGEEPDSGGEPERLEAFPHDLIAAAELPLMTLADRITLMAVQYGMVAGIAKNGERVTLRATNGSDFR